MTAVDQWLGSRSHSLIQAMQTKNHKGTIGTGVRAFRSLHHVCFIDLQCIKLFCHEYELFSIGLCKLITYDVKMTYELFPVFHTFIKLKVFFY